MPNHVDEICEKTYVKNMCFYKHTRRKKISIQNSKNAGEKIKSKTRKSRLQK